MESHKSQWPSGLRRGYANQPKSWFKRIPRKSHIIRISYNNTSNIHITEHWGAFAKPLLWTSNKYYIFLCVCVCVCVHVCVRARERVYEWVGARGLGLCMRTCVALLIQYATLMHHIVFVSVASLAPPHFCTLSHKRHDFRKKMLLNIKCVLIFCEYFI
jgi:hypothetical protein